MKIAGFTLSKHRITHGREGQGFEATLTYMGKPVATYEDYADGGGADVTLAKTGWGQKELSAAIHAIDDAQPIEFLKRDSMTSCAEYMCDLLEELLAIKKMWRRAHKNAGPLEYVLLLLTGDTWCCAVREGTSRHPGELHGYVLDKMAGSEQARNEAIRIILREKGKWEPARLRGMLLVKADASESAFDLTVEQYTAIYGDANKLTHPA